MTEATQGDALAAIASEDVDALKLVGDLMEYNARATAWGFEQAYLGEKDAHEQTKRRLTEANRQLHLIHRRIAWLFGGPEPDEWYAP
jgi:hypothetical protein